MTIKFQNIIDVLEEQYPASLAETSDKVGIHFGSKHSEVKRVMVALDVRPQVIDEAIEANVDTLIVHHPPIFKAITRFNTDDPQIAMYAKIAAHQINIFAMHTNIDKAKNGMNEWLVDKLQLQHMESLNTHPEEELGLGRIGNLKEALSRTELIKHVKNALNIDHITLIEKYPKETYQRIAIIGGSGSDFALQAFQQKADVFITGDITYHTGHDCFELDMLTMDVGHYVEEIFIDKITELLNDFKQTHRWDIDILASKTNTNPFEYI